MMEKSILFFLVEKISKFVKELKIEIITQPLKAGATDMGHSELVKGHHDF